MNRSAETGKNPFRMSDPVRYQGLFYVKTMIIKKMLSFDLLEDENACQFFDFVGAGTKFPSRSLCSKRVKCHVVELYSATKASIMKDVEAVQRTAILLPFSLGIDMWKCAVTGDKYLGVRLSWVDLSGKSLSPLLEVKKYDYLSLAKDAGRGSEIIAIWTQEVLKEFGVMLNMLSASVSDCVSDIKRACTTVIGTDWEYSMVRMINCSIASAFGLYPNADKGKEANPDAFAVTCAVRKVTARFQRSYYKQQKEQESHARASALATLAMDRWSC